MIEGLLILCVLAIIGFTCNYLHQRFGSSEAESEEVTDIPKQTVREYTPEEIIVAALRELQCNISSADQDKYHLSFEYQSEHFTINWSEDSRFVHLYDTFWYSFDKTDIDQLAKVKRIINDINWNSEVTLSYSLLESDDTFNVHVTHSMLCVDTMDFTAYLQHILRECFIAHNQFYKRLSEI